MLRMRQKVRLSLFRGRFPSFAEKPYAPHETLCRIEGALFRRERERFGVVRKAENMCATISE